MARDLRPLFDPRSVAIVGASDDPAKWGNWLGRGALQGEHRRPVYLVNRNGGTVLGRTAYRSLADLPAAPELVVVAVPGGGVRADGRRRARRRRPGADRHHVGPGRAGRRGGSRARRRWWRGCAAAGAVLLGPNCLGVYDAGSDLGLASNEFPRGHDRPGLAERQPRPRARHPRRARSGSGSRASPRSETRPTSTWPSWSRPFAEHAATEVIAVYAEDFRDGRAFVDAAAAAGKPVVLLTVGAQRGERPRRPLAYRARWSATSRWSRRPRCRRRAHVVRTPHQMIDLVQALVRTHPLPGPRIAVLGDGGGHGAIACDVAAAAGLELPRAVRCALGRPGRQLPHTAATRNPVDLAGGGEQDFHSYARVSRTLLESGEVDGVLLTGYFGGYSQYSEELRRARGRRGAQHRGRRCRDGPADGRALDVRRLADRRGAARGRRPRLHRDRGGGGCPGRAAGRARPAGAPPLPPAADRRRSTPGYFGSRALLEAAGVPFAPAVRVQHRRGGAGRGRPSSATRSS